MPRRVLIVDDNPEIAATLGERFELAGYVVGLAQTPAAALAVLDEFKPELVVLDVYLDEGRSGLEVLRAVRARHLPADLPVMVITGQPTSPLLLEAMQGGANDFLRKPVDLDLLLEKAGRLLAAPSGAPAPEPGWTEQLVGSSPPALDLARQVWDAARSQADTLILGETGAGKDLAARQIHAQGPRAQRPFVMIDCTAIPPALFESEVFGHEKGAFTGAASARTGRLEGADGGVVFFNEIGDLPEAQQAKLLTFYDHRSFHRVGGGEPVTLDVQVLAATNADLEERVASGRFRKDLYYRLRSRVLTVPPLRARLEDLPELVAYLIGKLGSRVRNVEPEVLALLVKHNWPGNVRELEKLLAAAVQNCPDATLRMRDLPWSLSPVPAEPGAAPGLDQPFAAFRKEVVEAAYREYLKHHLHAHQGNVSAAAKAIGVSREQLNYLLKRYGVRDQA